MKDGIVAKLCSQCDDMFSNVMRSMQKEDVRSLWDSDWLPNISGKQALYKGLAQYFQSKVAAENKEIGEEIARQVIFFLKSNIPDSLRKLFQKAYFLAGYSTLKG